MLIKHPGSEEEMAEKMYKMLEENDRLEKILKEPKTRATYETKVKRETIRRGNKTRRVRKEWAKVEDEVVEEGIRDKKSFKEIADELYLRTPDDVRLHLRWKKLKSEYSKLP